MNALFKKNKVIVISVIAATSILIATFIANGSQYEDAWLYITGFWIVVLPLWDVFFSKRNKK